MYTKNFLNLNKTYDSLLFKNSGQFKIAPFLTYYGYLFRFF